MYKQWYDDWCLANRVLCLQCKQIAFWGKQTALHSLMLDSCAVAAWEKTTLFWTAKMANFILYTERKNGVIFT